MAVPHLTKFDVGGFDIGGGSALGRGLAWCVTPGGRRPCHMSLYFIHCLLFANDTDSRGGTESADVIGQLRVSLHGHGRVRARYRSDTSRRVVGRRQHGAQV